MPHLDEHDERQALRARLSELEQELHALRRELAAGEERRALVPEPPFQILKALVGEDVYGIPIDRVVEIVRYVRLTQVADMPQGVVGALNLRGSIHAVLDGRLRFGLPPASPRLGTSIVMLNVRGHCTGLVLDRVLEVVTVADQLEQATGPLAGAHGVLALATLDTDVVQIVDVDRLLSGAALDAVEEALTSITPEPDACTVAALEGEQ